ncbi:hypothetical protein ACFQ5N_02120 [Lutibacter holmesii]|uniref:Uncharacterized protein n=1 Tax=Lutibacter holmesii TaxID=1137985 RepID=A0ABW3WKM1_9FLAO
MKKKKMKIRRTIEILEALASGCSPQTGELIENDSVLNERDVIRALEKAISELERINISTESKSENKTQTIELNITTEEIKKTIKLFQSIEYNPTYSRLTHFFLKSKQFDFPILNSNDLYGKYFGYYTKQDLHKFFKHYLIENGFSLHGKVKKEKKPQPWQDIEFFKQEKFNNLTDKAVEQLKSKINEIGILKTEDLSQHTINSRVRYFRAYENWNDYEKELLEKAMEYTNDLELLSECFQRGKGSIESYGKRLIYEKKPVANNS